MAMHDSPRLRRLRNDLAALERLRSESTVFQFQATGSPSQNFQISFRGKSLYRDQGKVKVGQVHKIEIKLGASYPRTIPEIRWVTPIYHPNISEIGMVCLGGYGTHWVPSVQLDELCTMLWDMARYHNYDIRSPYNRDAALWVANQTSILFPLDSRPIRDVRAAQGRIELTSGKSEVDGDSGKSGIWGKSRSNGSDGQGVPSPVARVRQFIERYGRVFGDGIAPASGQRPAAGEENRRVPEYSRGNGQFDPGTNGWHEPSEPLASDVTESVANQPLPLPLVSHHETAPSAGEEVVILEASDATPKVPERTRPAGEDIVFID